MGNISIAGLAGAPVLENAGNLRPGEVLRDASGREYVVATGLVAGHLTSSPKLTAMRTEWIVENGPPGYTILSSHQSAFIIYAENGRNVRSRTLNWSGPGGVAVYDFGDELVCGNLMSTCTLTWLDPRDGQTKQTVQRTLPWRVIGDNPSKAEIKSLLPDLQLQVICYLESRFRQFGPSGTPLFNGPHGFGVMQLDYPQATDLQLFNWRQNLAAGIALHRTKKRELETVFKRVLTTHPEAKPIPPEKFKLALYQYYNGGTYYSWSNTAKDWVVQGPTSYGDNALAVERAVLAGSPPAEWN